MEEKAKALRKEQAAAKNEERQDTLEADMQSHTGDKHTPIYTHTEPKHVAADAEQQSKAQKIEHWNRAEARTQAHIKALSNQKKLSFMRGIANAFAFRG